MCGKRNEGDGLGHEGGKKISKAGMERIKEMMDAKARQSMMAAFFTRAASPQSRLGQILVSYINCLEKYKKSGR